jgi:hypothetical protein
MYVQKNPLGYFSWNNTTTKELFAFRKAGDRSANPQTERDEGRRTMMTKTYYRRSRGMLIAP